MRQAAVLFLTLALLWALVAELNHELSVWPVSLFVGGLFVATPAFRLSFGPGLIAALAGGWLCDAHAPVPFGTHALLFAGAYVLIFHFRDRLPHDDTAGRIGVALGANLALFLGLSVFFAVRFPHPGASWLRLGVDLIASQIFLALIAPWFFALQERCLVLARPRRGRLLG